MKARFLTKFLAMIFVFAFLNSVNAQEKASAEFISAHKPPVSMFGVQAKDGIKQVQIHGNTLFVVDEYTGLQILDVSDVHHPKEIATVGATHLSQNVALEGNLAFLSGRLDGVYIIDVSNPSRPKVLSHLKPVAESFWVEVHDSTLFVAEADSGIAIYDISDLTHPDLLKVLHIKGGFTWGLGVKDHYLFALDKRNGMLIFDVSDPAHPKKVGDVKEIVYARSILFQGPYVYVANGPAGLWVLDVSRLAAPKILNKIAMQGYAHSATKSGNNIFVGNDALNALQFFDVKDPVHPQKEGEYKTNSHIYNAVKKDVYVYVAADSNTLILRYNRPPQLEPIADQEVDENQTLTFQAKAYEPDGDPIYFTLSPLAEGMHLDSLSGIFTWKPTYEQSGVYPVTITVHERTQSHLTDSKSFKITVHHVNRPPTIADIPDYEVDENQTLTFTIPEGQDPDKEDAGKLTYTADNLPPGATFNPQTRVFTWKPTYEQSGVYTIDFAVHDPAGAFMRDASTITVHHVDRPPTLEPVPPQTIPEGQTLTIKLHGSDPDKEDQDKLSYQAFHLPPGATFDAATATFTWTPTYDQSGVYKNILFVFTAGALSDSVTTAITVTHVNRPPVITALPPFTVDENKLLRFVVEGNDPDKEDAGKLKFRAENLPEGATFSPDSNVFRWIPTYEQSGVYPNVRFIVQDPAGLSDTATTTITVNHVNRPPVLAAIPAQTVDENQPLTIVLQGSDPDKEDADKLTYTAKSLPPGAKLEGNQFTWTPNYDQSGTYTITFTVSDGQYSDSKQVTITVNHVNRPPVLAKVAPQSVDENQPLTFKVTASDPDKEDSGKLTLAAKNLPEGATFDTQSGTFSWTPTFEQSGEYAVTFVVSDPAGLQDSLQVPITVVHVNRTPVFPEQKPQIVDENQPLHYQLIPATDPDKEDAGKLKYSVTNLPQGATFDPQTRTLSWTPDFDQSGTYTVEFAVTDGEFTVTQPLQITVKNVDRPPVIAAIAPQQTDENTEWTLKIEASDPDKEDAGKLHFSVSNLPQGMTFDSTTATFHWKPTYDQAGTYPGITVQVSDAEGLKDEKSFTIVVNNVNRPPVLEPVSPVKGLENRAITIQLKASDPDKEDAGKLTFASDNLPKGASLDAQSGLFQWTPDFLQAGNYEIHFKVSDTGGLSAEQTATITVADSNRAPSLESIGPKTVKENQKLTFTVTGKDADTDNTLTYSAENLPQGARFDAQTHTFEWTPNFEQAGNYTVTFVVSDGKAQAKTNVAITVLNVNRAPQFDGLQDQTVKEGELLKLKVQAHDPDAGAKIVIAAKDLPQGATFDAQNATLTWRPTFEQAGTYPIVFTVSDGDTTVKKQITIEVQNVNRPPVFAQISDQTVKENEQVQFQVQASDPDAGTTLQYSVKNLPKGATFDAKTGTFTWTPDFTQSGTYEIEFVVSDGETSVSKVVKVTVENVNRPPQIKGPDKAETEAGSSVEVQFKGEDPDNNPLTYSASGLPNGATLDAHSGLLRWTPGETQTGEFTIEVKVSDGQAEAATTATIVVKPKPQSAAPDTTQGN